MATRSNSNRGVSRNSTNGSSMSIGRNYTDNTKNVKLVEGLTEGTTYGEGQAIKQQAATPIPDANNLPTPSPVLQSIDRPTEKMEENIMTGAQTIQPGNFTVSNAQNFPIARPGTEYKNSDMVSAYVQSGFNDDILNILLRTT